MSAESIATAALASYPSHLPSLGGLPETTLVLALLLVSRLLIFAGRTIVKILAFLVVGIVGASIGGTLGAHYLSGLGTLAGIIGALLGFVVGGIVGVVFLALGIGAAFGYAAYLLTLGLTSSHTAAIAVGIVFFFIGVIIHGKILTIVTAIAGGLLLYDVLRIVGLDILISTVVAVLVTALGLYFDFRTRKPIRPPPPQPS